MTLPHTMSTTRSSRSLSPWIALFLGSAACTTPTTVTPNTTPTVGTADPTAPRASVVNEDDPNAVPLESSVRKVTVYSDRAMVTRTATAKLSVEPTVLVFRALPGWVDEGSVRVATTGGRILDVRVGRSYLSRSTDESFQKAESDARALRDSVNALNDELVVLDAQTRQITDIRAFSLDALTRDLHAGTSKESAPRPGGVGVDTYASVVEFVGDQLRALAKARRAVDTERERLQPELEASQKRLDELEALSQVEETKVFVTLASPTPGDTALELSYMLPGATWEAAHELRATDAEPNKVELTSYAVVTQASGEDWDDAELSFSTQSSTAAVQIPELDALTLGAPTRRTQTTERRSASFTRAESAIKDQNLLWNKRNQSSTTIRDFEQSYSSNMEHLEIVQSKTVQIFQSLEQRGTTAQFKALSTTRVRADGRSVRVPIGRTEPTAKRAIVAAPEQSLNAAVVVELVNEGGQSILPGTVSLYQSGAFLGITDLDFVADGERFSVFQSVADHLKLSRVLDKKRSAIVRKTRTQMQLAFVVTVENLSNKASTLELADRLPVSEDKDVVISGIKLSPDAKADSKGIIRFPVTLQPKEKRTFQIQYTIEYPPTLVLEMRKNEAAEPSPAGPFRPAPRKSFDVKKDIQQLELMF